MRDAWLPMLFCVLFTGAAVSVIVTSKTLLAQLAAIGLF